MSNEIDDLKGQIWNLCLATNAAMGREDLSEALQYLEQAKELLEQVRELAFRDGQEDGVVKANAAISRCIEDMNRIRRVQVINALPGQINTISTLPPREDMH